MSRLPFIVFLVFVSLLNATPGCTAQPTSRGPRLSEQVQSLIARFPGTVGIDAVNLKTGAAFSFHADDPVPTASTIKLPIMIELFYEASEGRLDWNQKLELTEAEKVSGSGVLT